MDGKLSTDCFEGTGQSHVDFNLRAIVNWIEIYYPSRNEVSGVRVQVSGIGSLTPET